MPHIETLSTDEIKILSDLRNKLEASDRIEAADEISDIITGYSEIDD